MSDTFSLLLAVIFLMIFLVSVVITLLSQRHRLQKRLHRHLDQLNGEQPVHQMLRKRYVEQLPPWLQRLEQLPFMVGLDLLTLQAGKSTRALVVVVCSLGLLFLGMVATQWLEIPWFSGVMISVVLAALPVGYLERLKNKRLQLFDQQLPDLMDMVVKALRAGLPLTEAMELAARELDDPVASELKQTVQDIHYSKDMKHAFLAMLERVSSEALLMMVTAILLQRETGGNLLEVLTGLRGQIRERIGFDRRLKTLSAEGRMSAWILVLLPFVLAFVINLTSPGYLTPLQESDVGRNLLIGAGVLMVVGVVWVIHLVRIRV